MESKNKNINTDMLAQAGYVWHYSKGINMTNTTITAQIIIIALIVYGVFVLLPHDNISSKPILMHSCSLYYSGGSVDLTEDGLEYRRLNRLNLRK